MFLLETVSTLVCTLNTQAGMSTLLRQKPPRLHQHSEIGLRKRLPCVAKWLCSTTSQLDQAGMLHVLTATLESIRWPIVLPVLPTCTQSIQERILATHFPAATPASQG